MLRQQNGALVTNITACGTVIESRGMKQLRVAGWTVVGLLYTPQLPDEHPSRLIQRSADSVSRARDTDVPQGVESKSRNKVQVRAAKEMLRQHKTRGQ